MHIHVINSTECFKQTKNQTHDSGCILGEGSKKTPFYNILIICILKRDNTNIGNFQV